MIHRVSRSLCVTLLAVAAAVAAAAMMREDERVEELMERVHEGRRSPYRAVAAQAEADRPAWAVVEAALPPFDAMARALVASPVDEIKDSADGYVEAVKELVAAARKRDPEALKDAFTALEQSCGDCHFDGGVGGELEDDHDSGHGHGRHQDEEEEEEEDEDEDGEDEEKD